MRNKKPDMIVFGGDLYIRRDVLVKKIKQSRKVAMESYENHYDECIQEWLNNGDAFDIREEQKIKKQCSKNIGHAIDALARAIEGIEIE